MIAFILSIDPVYHCAGNDNWDFDTPCILLFSHWTLLPLSTTTTVSNQLVPVKCYMVGNCRLQLLKEVLDCWQQLQHVQLIIQPVLHAISLHWSHSNF